VSKLRDQEFTLRWGGFKKKEGGQGRGSWDVKPYFEKVPAIKGGTGKFLFGFLAGKR